MKKMKIKKTILIKISLIGFLLIFLLIYFIEENTVILLTKISEIDNTYINKYVKITGNIVKLKNSNSSTFITIKNNENYLKGIIFEKIKLKKEKKYIFEGKISKYNNELEIIINEYY